MSPVTYPGVYDSWMECSKAAHIESMKLLEEFDLDFVNKNNVGMKYNCKPVTVY
jgi:hypothetical protein